MKIASLGLAVVALVGGTSLGGREGTAQDSPTPPKPKQERFLPRGVLGIRIVDIAPGLEDVAGLATWRGAYVIEGSAPPPRPFSDSLPTTDADLDVLESADLIVGLNDRPIISAGDFFLAMDGKRPGQIVRLKIIRGGTEIALRCRLKDGPPLVYIPARLCLNMTTGSEIGIEIFASFMGAGPVFAIPYGSEITGCMHFVDPCTPIGMEDQDERRTLIDGGDVSYKVLGDWRAHTHGARESCLAEQRQLDALREKAAKEVAADVH